MHPAIGIDQAVHAEIAVVGEFTKIAAVIILFPTVGVPPHIEGMIAPFPHKRAYEPVVRLDKLHVVL